MNSSKKSTSEGKVAGIGKEKLIAVVLILAILASFANIAYTYDLGRRIDGKPTIMQSLSSAFSAGSRGGSYAKAPAGAPKAEFFVMSHCPYGLQMQKAIVPVMELLAGKADIQVKWVSYAMHGEIEIQDNIRQYCIQRDQPDKYTTYLRCFVGSLNHDACVSSAGVDVARLKTCYDETYSAYGGKYPNFALDGALNTQYGVQGSPTFVLDGQEIQVQRSAEAVKTAICDAFTTGRPAECSTTLSSAEEAAGQGLIGSGSAAAGSAASCG